MFGLIVGLALLFQADLVHAQAGDDPPARVARVGDVIGDVWLFDTENREWTRVLRNQTLGQGDRLRTDDRARVALRIGSTSVWVDERSDLSFSRLDEGSLQLQLDKGDLGLRLRASEAATDTHVLTREGEMVPEREGLYRVEQLENDRGSRASVWQGRLRFEPARGEGIVPPTWLQNGEQAEFWWANGPRVERQSLQADSFGDWIITQNQRENGSGVAQRYVSPEMTGVEDLDRNGRWEQSPDYGAIWIPTAVGPDWAPYREGRWVWTNNWGWTWVDDAPWGFAPFHYGRWVQYGGRWCWSPGAYVARPVYAPALVGWVGNGGVSVNINIGGGRSAPPRYGWYPLAPREVYEPPYRHSPVYGDRLNGPRWQEPPRGRPPVSNREVPGAISFVPGQGGPARGWQRGDLRDLKPQPIQAPPARGDVGNAQPQRPAPEARPSPDMPWRGESRGGNSNNGNWRGNEQRNDQRNEQRNDRQPPVPQQAQPAPQAQPEPRGRDAGDAWRQQQRSQNPPAQQPQAQPREEERQNVRISPIERQSPERGRVAEPMPQRPQPPAAQAQQPPTQAQGQQGQARVRRGDDGDAPGKNRGNRQQQQQTDR